MADGRSIALSQEFDTAFSELAAARVAYEDQPRDPQRIADLGAARKRLEAARTLMADERERLGLDSPWRTVPSTVHATKPPPLWSVHYSSGA